MIKYEQYPFLTGQLTIFYSQQGIQFVTLADKPLAAYQAWFGTADFLLVTEQQYADVVTAYLKRQSLPDFQVDYQHNGTPLQRQIWDYLQQLPTGQWLTYQRLAIALGQPKAVRAVASAVAKNPILVFGACHRIVRSDGTIGQYRDGQNWKQRLQGFEQN